MKLLFAYFNGCTVQPNYSELYLHSNDENLHMVAIFETVTAKVTTRRSHSYN